MVEKDSADGEYVIGLAVIYGYPVGVEFGHPVWTFGMKRGSFVLGRGSGAEHPRSGGLVEFGFVAQAEELDGFQYPQGSQGVGVGGVFRGIERDLDMALGSDVVYLIRLYFLDEADEVGGVGEISVVENEIPVFFMRVLVEMVHSFRIKRRGPSFEAVDLVTFFQKKFRQIGAVLAGDTGD